MKRKLILLHGALGTDAQMFPLAKRLSAHFEIQNVLFHGHGSLDAGAVLTWILWRSNLLQACKKKGLWSLDTAWEDMLR